MENNTIFVSGMIFKKPNDKAPEWIKGNIVIKVEDFVKFLNENKGYIRNGWININLKKSKGGKLYLVLDTWKPAEREESREEIIE